MFLQKFIKNFEQIKFIVNVNLLEEIETILEKTIVYGGPQYDGKQKSVARLLWI